MTSGKMDMHLDKWYLDFTSDDGETLICYAARLSWKGIRVPYSSILHHVPGQGTRVSDRFSKLRFPRQEADGIHWEDPLFKMDGLWEPCAAPLRAELFSCPSGRLDWHCHQPLSRVKLSFNGRWLEGMGYAEQLCLTAYPWRIPMDELRWGRYGSEDRYWVWIEILGEENKQWVWVNGERTGKAQISDSAIVIPEKKLQLQLDRSMVLESEKKIHSVTGPLTRVIPGFKNLMPMRFLLSDETKWGSRAEFYSDGELDAIGFAIHERVSFQS